MARARVWAADSSAPARTRRSARPWWAGRCRRTRRSARTAAASRTGRRNARRHDSVWPQAGQSIASSSSTPPNANVTQTGQRALTQVWVTSQLVASGLQPVGQPRRTPAARRARRRSGRPTPSACRGPWYGALHRRPPVTPTIESTSLLALLGTGPSAGSLTAWAMNSLVAAVSSATTASPRSSTRLGARSRSSPSAARPNSSGLPPFSNAPRPMIFWTFRAQAGRLSPWEVRSVSSVSRASSRSSREVVSVWAPSWTARRRRRRPPGPVPGPRVTTRGCATHRIRGPARPACARRIPTRRCRRTGGPCPRPCRRCRCAPTACRRRILQELGGGDRSGLAPSGGVVQVGVLALDHLGVLAVAAAAASPARRWRRRGVDLGEPVVVVGEQAA